MPKHIPTVNEFSMSNGEAADTATMQIGTRTLFGAKIRNLRQAKGYTYEKLSEVSGLSQTIVWGLENKPPKRPAREKVCRIAAALEVTPEWLVANEVPSDESDETFFAQYRNLDTTSKELIRRMVEFCFTRR